jgi:hypothetical protein
LIISNFVLNILIALYFVLNHFFGFFLISLRIWFNLIFISTLVLILFIVIYFFLILFLINFFIYQIWSQLFWFLFILFKIIYEIGFFFNFIIFYMADLILILFIDVCFVWNNLSNWISFSILSSFGFFIFHIWSLFF